MIRILQRAYYRSPVFLQNLAVTVYGWRLRRERHSAESSRFLEELLESANYSRPEMEEYVDSTFAQMMTHALETVPFWREWAEGENAEPQDFRGVSDLSRMPVLNRSMIQKAPERFVSEVRPTGPLIHLSTSGTTGSPLSVLCDRLSRSYHYAFYQRIRRWYGVGLRDHRATFYGRVIMDPANNDPPFWRYDAAQKNMLFSSYHLSQENAPYYAQELMRFRPAEVLGYPSSLYELAKAILDRGLEVAAPNYVMTTAETLMEHQREVIQDAFRCPVINQYGCTEMAFFAAECNAGNMHIHPEHGWIEVLDDDDREIVTPGETGRCVATGFVNRIMPLVRYDIGDRVTVGRQGCSCGLSFPVLGAVDGRADDVITTPTGRRVGRMDPVFKERSGIAECQIVQSAPDVLELRVVPASTFDQQAERDLQEAVSLRVGAEMKIAVTLVDKIPRGPNGKFRAVVRSF